MKNASKYRGVLIGVLAGFVGAFGNSAHAGYFQGLGDLPGGLYRSFSRGISGDGLVITGNGANETSNQQAFRWTAQTGMVSLPETPFGPISTSQGISRDGTTIFSVLSSGNPSVRWTEASGFESLGAKLSGFDPLSTNALLSTNGSVIVGGAVLPDSPFTATQPTRWSSSSGVIGFGIYPGSLICCGVAHAVSGDGSIVIGRVNDSPTYEHDRRQAFRWTEGTGMVGLGWLPGANPLTGSSAAYGITEDGTVIVGLSDSATGYQPFRWTQETGMVGLDVRLTPTGISGDGSKIYGPGAFGVPSIWDSVNGLRSAVEVFIAAGLDFAGWTIGEIRGMSSDGMTLTGNGVNPNGNPEAWVANLSASIPGSTPDNPLLPCSLDEGFTFCSFQVVDMGLTSPLYIDPVVAIGYDYAVSGGPLFASVLIPAALPGGDSLFELILPGFGSYSLLAGTTFDLLTINASGFDEFRIEGIDPSEMLDPSDATAFVTGVTFTNPGTVNITQKPLTVPGPLPIMGLAFGYRWSRLLRRRLNFQHR